MKKRESELKAGFVKELHNLCPNFLIFTLATAGAPDKVIIGGGKTTFWEFKHCTPEFDSPDLQELLCMRLEVEGYCRYALWWEVKGEGRRTMVVKPRIIYERQKGLTPEAWTTGFDHTWLAAYIIELHSNLML